MYALELQDAAPIEIKHTNYKFDGLKFNFSRCPDADNERGKLIKSFIFEQKDKPHDLLDIVVLDSKDTLEGMLYKNSGIMSFYSLYTCTLFKLSDEEYRLNIKLSTRGWGSLSQPVLQKMSNILVQIKP